MGRAYQWNGFVGIDAIAKAAGLKPNTLRTRMQRYKLTLEEAINYQPKSSINTEFQYKGLVGIKAIADAFGINMCTLRYRVMTTGMSIEEAIKASAIDPETKHQRTEMELEAKEHDLWALALGRGQIQ